MDFYVNLERPGYRVARRRRATNKVGVQHKVTKEDAIKWCAGLPGWGGMGDGGLTRCACTLAALLPSLPLPFETLSLRVLPQY